MTKIDEVMNKVNETIEFANKKMESITKGGFPFAFEEVKLSIDHDSVGVYVHSGKTPVSAVKWISYSSDRVVAFLNSAIWATVDATRTAVERRSDIKKDADALADEADQSVRAAEALKAAGLPTDMLGSINPSAAEAIISAATRAVLKANVGIFMVVGDIMPIKEAKMYVKGFSNGIVVLAGDKPCLVTRFPKVLNAKGVERTLRFIEADIAALNESRRAYFMKIRRRLDDEQKIRRDSDRYNSARIAAAM